MQSVPTEKLSIFGTNTPHSLVTIPAWDAGEYVSVSEPSAAQAAVFTSVSQFRSAYRDAFGHAAQHTPRRGGRTWIQPGTKQ